MINEVRERQRAEYSRRNFNAVEPQTGYLSRSLWTVSALSESWSTTDAASPDLQLTPVSLASLGSSGGEFGEMAYDAERDKNRLDDLGNQKPVGSDVNLATEDMAFEEIPTARDDPNDDILLDDDFLDLEMERAPSEINSPSAAELPPQVADIWSEDLPGCDIWREVESHSSEACDDGYTVIPSMRDDGSSSFDQSTVRFEQHQDYLEIFENVHNGQWFRVRDSRTLDSVGPDYNIFGVGTIESRRSLHHYITKTEDAGKDCDKLTITNHFILVEARRLAGDEIRYMSEEMHYRMEDTPEFSTNNECIEWFLRMFTDSYAFCPRGNFYHSVRMT